MYCRECGSAFGPEETGCCSPLDESDFIAKPVFRIDIGKAKRPGPHTNLHIAKFDDGSVVLEEYDEVSNTLIMATVIAETIV